MEQAKLSGLRVAMLLSNAFRPDPRVLKEAQTLAQAGYDVTVVAWDREGKFPPEERVGGLGVRRVQDRTFQLRCGATADFPAARFLAARLAGVE